MSVRYFSSERTMEERSSYNGSRERLGLSFTIDYLLFNKGVKGSKEEPTASRTADQTANNVLNHQNPKPKEVGIHCEVQEKQQWSEAETAEKKVKEEEGDEEQHEEGEEEMTTTTSTSGSPSKSADKPNQSYIALISKAILASEQKKLLLCDIYQWIMDHYPYFKSKVCSRFCSFVFSKKTGRIVEDFRNSNWVMFGKNYNAGEVALFKFPQLQ